MLKKIGKKKKKKKIEIEITISIDETIYLLILDMSKAFDSIQRNSLIEDLKKCPESRRTTFDLNPARCENYSQMW